jgi:hypothetical protein
MNHPEDELGMGNRKRCKVIGTSWKVDGLWIGKYDKIYRWGREKRR